ncbi:protein Exd1 homolog [Drosophila hydei]|uniref:Protein Exd1 homolog n=1 Tax=Drosophila hydei TaxID=7224 RepID=A0A6J1LRG0_DROHY|nr:protein Exd1 homolog [Drosophila hydei]
MDDDYNSLEDINNNSNYEDIDNNSTDSYDTADDWERKSVKTKTLQPHELLSLEQKLQRIIVIQQTDQSYHQALNDIRDQAIISVLVEPSFYGRHCKTSVIVIATANNTYVFDLKALGAIFPELGVLLEAEYPRKIMHYSHRICDLLLHQHKLKVNGICDTFVALCVARQDRSHCTLQDAITLILELAPTELTCNEITSANESVRTFTARPLSRSQLRYLATLAILQHRLHDTLIYGNICFDLQEMSEKFSCEFNRQKRSDEVALNMQPGSNAGFDCINPYYKISTPKE